MAATRRELGVVDQRGGLRVVEQVEQFLFDIAVADVEGCDTGAVGRDHRLEVLVAVAQVQPEVILSRFVTGQRGALRVTAEPGRGQIVGDAGDAVGELRVGQPACHARPGLVVPGWRPRRQ